MNKLFGDLKTDEEKRNFFLSGRGYETGVIAAAIQYDVAMAYHRCAEYKKELAALQAPRTEAVQGEPVAVMYEDGSVLSKADCGDNFEFCCKVLTPLYTAPQPAEQQPPVTREEITKWRDDALEQAAQICDRYGLDAYGAGHDIRVLKSDYKFAPHNTHKSTSDDMCGAEIAVHRKQGGEV